MDYSIKELSDLSGVSLKALRYYERLGLLTPERNPDNTYRVYHQSEVDRLQAILFYKETGMKLSDIAQVIGRGDGARTAALQQQLLTLRREANRIDKLIQTLEKTMQHIKGENTMSDNEKFEGFKRELIQKNEEKYGDEAREKFGKQVISDSNAKLMGMDKASFDQAQALSEEVNRLLMEAALSGDTRGELAQQLCEKHRDWIKLYWPVYTKEMHLGLAETYVTDERFAKYYDDIVPGGAVFLRDALKICLRD